MKIAFHVGRINFYRFYGPIIDEALSQGIQVECWHDYSASKSGFKGNLFPSISAAPKFRNGEVQFNAYNGLDELRSLLLENRADFFVSFFTPAYLFKDEKIKFKTKWVCLQNGIDFFSINKWTDLKSADLIFTYGSNWIEFGQKFNEMIKKEKISPSDAENEKLEFISKTRNVGWPQADQVSFIDPHNVREKLNIPFDAQVVLLCPMDIDVLCIDHESESSFNVYNQFNRLGQLKACLKSKSLKRIPKVLKGESYGETLKSIKSFCERNNALLIIKARNRFTTKTNIGSCLLNKIADKIIYDESFYPATIFEVMSISSLCIHFYSLSVTEAAFLNIPSIAVKPYDSYLRIVPELKNNSFYEFCEFDLFDAPFITKVTGETIPKLLQSRSLDDFKMSKESYIAYRSKYYSNFDFSSSKNVIKELTEFNG